MTAQEHDPTDLPAQERTAAQGAEEERLAKEREQSDLKWVMSTKQGRRFIYRRLSEAGVWRLSFNTNNAVMAFNEGYRNAGLELLNEITEVCPERYTEMLTEQKEAKDATRHRNADHRSRRK